MFKVDEDSELQLIFPRPYCVFDSRYTLISIHTFAHTYIHTLHIHIHTHHSIIHTYYTYTYIHTYIQTCRETILRIKELGFCFPGQAPLFSQIDFTVGPKTRMVMLGKNGCGKRRVVCMYCMYVLYVCTYIVVLIHIYVCTIYVHTYIVVYVCLICIYYKYVYTYSVVYVCMKYFCLGIVGKTTLLNLLIGDDTPTAGQVSTYTYVFE